MLRTETPDEMRRILLKGIEQGLADQDRRLAEARSRFARRRQVAQSPAPTAPPPTTRPPPQTRKPAPSSAERARAEREIERALADNPALVAAGEWKINKNNCNEKFLNQQIYTNVRVRELRFERQQADGAKALASAASSDAKAQHIAKAEWKANTDHCQQKFISEAVYVAARKRELNA